MKIVTYQERDKDQIINLIVGIQRNEFQVPITADEQPDLNDIPGYYQVGAGNFWVARLSEKVVGTISLVDIGNGQAALRKMFVEKDFRGREHGIAKKLLMELIDWAKSQNLKEIFLGTTSKYHAAHRFYEKNGFVEIAKEDLPENFSIMEVDTKFYKYHL